MDEDADSRRSPIPDHEKGEKKKKGMIVILMGAPGSGKTTFCNDVMSAARRSWVRICQDTIANGKSGTKLQCLISAANALKDGQSVFIDRCNLEREQRTEFVKLGGSQADVHAVVLDLPARLCISRSVKRTGHEGNLQGGKAAAVVNRMLQKKELPKLAEGFFRITFCQNENDVKSAVNTYSLLGPSDTLASGCFGQKCSDAKVQIGIMKYLKKVEPVSQNLVCDRNKAVSDGSNSKDFFPMQECKAKDLSVKVEGGSEGNKDIECVDVLEKPYPSNLSWNDVPTLAFPSISTSDFQFNHEKASDIIIESVDGFLNKVNKVRLVLVDLSHKSNILSLVRAKAAKKNIDSNKFFTFVGDITQLCTKGNLYCNVIANAANWRLKPGGGGVNAAIFNAAGETLERATKERAETLTPGSAVAVPLPLTSPLHQREGVTHVIHVLGPNMNPQRPNCLKNDFVKGCQILRNAYSALFEKFASISQSPVYSMRGDTISKFGFIGSQNVAEGITGDQLPNSDQKIEREGVYESERYTQCKDRPNIQHDDPEFGHSEINSMAAEYNANTSDFSGANAMLDEKEPKNKNAEGSKRTWSSWAQALYQTAMNPEKHKDAVVEISDDFVVLNDLYPKAKRHILLVSRSHGLDSLADIREEHLPLLNKLHAAGLKWAEKFSSEDVSLIFRLGYHSVSSMRQLHLHVISQDFNSPHLKNKKHWNSFTSSFFRDSADVIEEISKYGAAALNDDAKLLSMELRCHRCRSAHPNVPRLKSHISNCKASFPSQLLQNGRLVFPSSKSCK